MIRFRGFSLIGAPPLLSWFDGSWLATESIQRDAL